MLNGYNKEIPYTRWKEYILMHPSSRSLSRYTLHTPLAISQPVVMLIVNMGSAMIMWGHLNPVTTPIFALWTLLIFIRMYRSYWIKGETYNTYLLPIEKAFNKMSRTDRRRYKKHLVNAYRMCSKGERVSSREINATRELFELSVCEEKHIEDINTSDVELELKTLHAKIKEEEEKKRLVAEARAEQDKIIREIEEGIKNGH